MDYGSMTAREVIGLLDSVYDAIEEEWSDSPNQARYLEAIDHAQDALRDELHREEDSLRDQIVKDATHRLENHTA